MTGLDVLALRHHFRSESSRVSFNLDACLPHLRRDALLFGRFLREPRTQATDANPERGTFLSQMRDLLFRRVQEGGFLRNPFLKSTLHCLKFGPTGVVSCPSMSGCDKPLSARYQLLRNSTSSPR